jgi:hypothetical protein
LRFAAGNDLEEERENLNRHIHESEFMGSLKRESSNCRVKRRSFLRSLNDRI